MGLFARFWQYSVDTYGGAPLLLLINLIQIAILAWVVAKHVLVAIYLMGLDRYPTYRDEVSGPRPGA